MRSKELTTAVPDSGKDAAIQVEVMLPVRQRSRGGGDKGQLGQVSKPVSQPEIPRVARLMALAIKFQDMVDRGDVCDYADLARLGYVSRARLTQIMNLLLLAPDIQEMLLLSDITVEERRLRTITKLIEWKEQRNSLA